MSLSLHTSQGIVATLSKSQLFRSSQMEGGQHNQHVQFVATSLNEMNHGTTERFYNLQHFSLHFYYLPQACSMIGSDYVANNRHFRNIVANLLGHSSVCARKSTWKEANGLAENTSKGARDPFNSHRAGNRSSPNSANPIRRSGRQCGPARLGARLFHFFISLFFLFSWFFSVSFSCKIQKY
jgi:hypothetical protein